MPAGGRALDEPVHDPERGRGEEPGPESVDDRAGLGRIPGEHPHGSSQPGDSEHDVDQEDGPPAEARDVGVDDEARQNGPPDRRGAHRRAEPHEGLAEELARERGGEDADALRDEHRAEAALRHSSHDQQRRVGRETARE